MFLVMRLNVMIFADIWNDLFWNLEFRELLNFRTFEFSIFWISEFPKGFDLLS